MGFALALLGFGKSALGAVAGWLGALLGWAGKDLRNAIILGLAVALALSTWHLGDARDERDQARASSATFEHAARTAIDAAWAWKHDYDRYDAKVRKAALDAAAADRAHAAAVARQIATIRERTAHDYQARLDDTRSALERVRQQYAAAVAAGTAAGRLGDGRAEAVPAALTARCQALGAADCDALLAALPGTLGAAEDNTSQLIALQAYVRAVLAIDFTGRQPGSAGVTQ